MCVCVSVCMCVCVCVCVGRRGGERRGRGEVERGGGEGLVIKLKKLPKLNLRGYWSQALINSTIFATFRLLFVLLCYNLA